MGKSFDNALLVGFEFVLGKGGANIFFRFLQEIDGREFVFVVGGAGGGGDGGRGGFGGGFGFGGGVGGKSGQGGGGDSELFDFGIGFFGFGGFFSFGFVRFGQGRGEGGDGGIEDFWGGSVQSSGGGSGGSWGRRFLFGEAAAETFLFDLQLFLLQLDSFGGLGFADSVVEVLVDEGAPGFAKGASEFGWTEFKEQDEDNEVREAEDEDGADLAEDGGEKLIVEEVADIAAGHFSGGGGGNV